MELVIFHALSGVGCFLPISVHTECLYSALAPRAKISYAVRMKNYNDKIAQPLLERFLRYVQTWITSDADKADEGIIPSTERQRDFAQKLERELHDLGIEDVHVTDHAYVCACISASKGYEKAPSIGLLAQC